MSALAKTPILICGAASTATLPGIGLSGIGLQPEGSSSANAGALASKPHNATMASAAAHLRKESKPLHDDAPEKVTQSIGASPLRVRSPDSGGQRTGQSCELKASFKNLASRSPATPS